MAKEKSCGAVVYTIKDETIYFLIEEMNKGYFSLPKGHTEENETEVITALREIKEETNLDVKLDTSFKEISAYQVGNRNMKDVIFFIGYFDLKQQIINQEREIKDIKLLPYDLAYKTLTYQHDKSILLKAYLHIIKEKVNKIVVIGCCGSGKSYLSKHIAKYTNLPLYHLDKIFWYGDWKQIPKDEFDEKHKEIINSDKWIIDGTYKRTLESRMEKADLVIFINLQTKTCLDGVNYRIQHQDIRDDITETCIEKEIDEEFKDYILNYKKNNHKIIYNYLKKYNKNILTIKSKKQKEFIVNYIKEKSI